MADIQENEEGRPLLFKKVEELKVKIDEYFQWCDDRAKKCWDEKLQKEYMISDPAPYTMSGLARRLGISRQSLINYKNKDEFLDTIKEAREKVHEDVETRLMGTRNERGAIFNLKNNFGWKDKSEIDQNVKGVINIKKISYKDVE